MKTRNQQIEVTFSAEPFRLVPLTGQDGDRIAEERQQSEADRAEAETKQEPLPMTPEEHNRFPKGRWA